MGRNSVFLAAVFAGAFAAEFIVDSGIDSLWEWNNKGVFMNL